MSWRYLACILGLSTACSEDGVLETALPVARLEATTLDFGPVAEHSRTSKSFEIQNVGRAPLEVTVDLKAGSSEDFLPITSRAAIAPSTAARFEVQFSPKGGGSDTGTLVVGTNDPSATTLTIDLHGGPIAPVLAISPDPVDFGPAGNDSAVTRTVQLDNTGLAVLRIASVELSGNPDFVIELLSLPAEVPAGSRLSLRLNYHRSDRADAGRLAVLSNDETHPRAEVRLLPDPFAACQDGEDDDQDGKTDFPDDPGCQSPTDEDETDLPDCQEGETTPCGIDIPPCAPGLRTCRSGAFGACEGGIVGSAETCNGMDDDCDTRVDEEVSEACQVHGCHGSRLCVESSTVAGGHFGRCLPTLATPELCNGADDDCNGTIDDQIETACLIHGCDGTAACLEGGTGTFDQCQPLISAEEVCNAQDDDCNGEADEGLPTQTCGDGACARTVPGCENGTVPTCIPGEPTQESCNRLDDDCNGNDDDGIPDQVCGRGICERTVPGCLDGSIPPCVPGTPTTELCNAQDDDCNGNDDDGIPDQVCGRGICQRTVSGCVAGQVPACVPGTPTTELCNAQDDDCNGTSDDGIPNQVCGRGICQRTVSGCVAGQVPACVPGTPATEICGNAEDEDCDGVAAACEICGAQTTAPDAQEPNDAPTSAWVVPFPGFGDRTYEYTLTFPRGDGSDWLEFQFPPADPLGGFASIEALVLCTGWAGAGCGTAATVGLEAWYYDDCFPQRDDVDDGRNGLAEVTSSGPISSFGICGLQRFRIRAYPSATVCFGEAIQATLSISVDFSQ